ncbi:MAG: acyl-CoA reductase [Kofleriaceae bacterium]
MKVTVVARSAGGATGDADLAELLDELTAAPRTAPYSDAVIAMCAQLAKRLLDDPMARRHPELMALGFFTRQSELERMRREFAAGARPDVVRAPHGLVFHIPPANVDTMFVYSWLLGALAGNASLVRVSRRSTPVIDRLLELVREVLATTGTSVAPSAFVRYDHDAGITAAISARCALRVIWGGDETIATIRAAPLPATGRDLTFADRWSMTALSAGAVAALDDAALHTLAEALANDVFWFGQLACSSPRLALWIGDTRARDAARTRLWPEVATVAAARGAMPEPSVRLAREAFIHRAILDGPVIERDDFGASLTVLSVDQLDGVTRDHPGGGLLFEATAPSLAALDRWVTRKDQTLTHFGFAREQLVELATRLAGRGIDRLVPVGRALSLARIWDGYDLDAQLVRSVHVVG